MGMIERLLELLERYVKAQEQIALSIAAKHTIIKEAASMKLKEENGNGTEEGEKPKSRLYSRLNWAGLL